MEAKKHHNLLYVIWRPRKGSSDNIQTKVNGLTSRKGNGLSHSPWKEDELSQMKYQGKTQRT